MSKTLPQIKPTDLTAIQAALKRNGWYLESTNQRQGDNYMRGKQSFRLNSATIGSRAFLRAIGLVG